jgi:hypothetical protein
MEQSQGNYPPPVYRNAIEPERERSLRMCCMRCMRFIG